MTEWLIYFGIAFVVFLVAFFVILGILYFSLVLVSLGAMIGLSYWLYLRYGVEKEETEDEDATENKTTELAKDLTNEDLE